MLLDDNLGKLVACPYCSAKRKELARDGEAEVEEYENPINLADALGIRSKFLTDKLIYENIIPDGELLFIEDESIEKQRDAIEKLYYGLSAGELPDSSMCFGISIKGRAELLAFPLLSKAYQSGLKVCPFISCTEYNHAMIAETINVLDFYNADLVVMLLNEGATRADLAIAKGLLQARGIKDKPTIFITTWTVEACSGLLGYFGNSGYSLATPVFLEYHTSKQKGHTKYINQLLGVVNGVVNEEGDEMSMEGEKTKRVSVGSNNNFSMSLDSLR
jgi:hypothetical protein